MISIDEKEKIFKAAEGCCCDRDGDIVWYNGRKYFIHIFNGTCELIVEDKFLVMEKNLRPCVVNDVKGLFHGWFNREDVIIKVNTLLREDQRLKLQACTDDKIIPSYCDLEKLKKMFGIVEFDDGTVKEVKPENIIFYKESEK